MSSTQSILRFELSHALVISFEDIRRGISQSGRFVKYDILIAFTFEFTSAVGLLN